MLKTITLGGSEIKIYNLFNILFIMSVAIFCFIRMNKLLPYCARMHSYGKTGKGQAVPAYDKRLIFYMTALQVILYAGLGMTLINTFANLFTNGNANYYGNLTAWLIVFFIAPIFLRISPTRNIDLFSPALGIGLFFSKLACFFDGCCSGFAADTFYFNQETGRREFPVQLVEAGVALLLFFLTLFYQKKSKRFGSVYPFYLTLYSFTRFFTEFLRDDLPDVAGRLDMYQILSIVFFVVGAALFVVSVVWGERITAFFDARNEAYYRKKQKTKH